MPNQSNDNDFSKPSPVVTYTFGPDSFLCAITVDGEKILLTQDEIEEQKRLPKSERESVARRAMKRIEDQKDRMSRLWESTDK